MANRASQSPYDASCSVVLSIPIPRSVVDAGDATLAEREGAQKQNRPASFLAWPSVEPPNYDIATTA